MAHLVSLIMRRVRTTILAALCTNVWFSGRAAAQKFMLTQHFPRCEPAQQEKQIHRLGSVLPFAAYVTNGSDAEETGHSQL